MAFYQGGYVVPGLRPHIVQNLAKITHRLNVARGEYEFDSTLEVSFGNAREQFQMGIWPRKRQFGKLRWHGGGMSTDEVIDALGPARGWL